MVDPYQILGVATNATDDEIKNAYRRLAKKYHPDLNADKQLAEAKMKEINLAYDTIKKMRSNEYYSYNNSSSHYYQNSYQDIEHLILNRQYYQALSILNNIVDKDSKWYYYASIIHYNLGNISEALSFIENSCNMDPNNYTYQNLKRQMHNRNNQFNNIDHNPFKFLFKAIFKFMIFTLMVRFILSIILILL